MTVKKDFVINEWLKLCCNDDKGRVQKKCVKFHTCFWTTHPPPKCGKNKKKTSCFLGFLAHLEQKFFWSFSPLPPSTTTTTLELWMELVGGVSAGWLRWVVAVDGLAVMGVGGSRGGGGWWWVAVAGVGIGAAWLSTWSDPPYKGKKSWSKMAKNCLKWILKACFFYFLK